VLLYLRRPWGDGTRAIRFEPSEFLERLAAMIPKPRINLLLYHGVFAPHARQRAEAVRPAREMAARRNEIAPCASTQAAQGRSSTGAGVVPDGSPGTMPSTSAIMGAIGATPEQVGLARPPPGYGRPRARAVGRLVTADLRRRRPRLPGVRRHAALDCYDSPARRDREDPPPPRPADRRPRTGAGTASGVASGPRPCG